MYFGGDRGIIAEASADDDCIAAAVNWPPSSDNSTADGMVDTNRWAVLGLVAAGRADHPTFDVESSFS
jgi:hypothetical protein